ncbi:MAG: TetR/AcrR family transcriptional regulator [Akkermansiaceae bacterium]|nr:TetR/AcrR family transcriptional regulator [Armatimonadota bacterium]
MSTRSSSRKEERKDQRRRDILDVASRLFSDRGYENVTLRAIAEELGYAHATLYRYFPDKSCLLEELCLETFALLTAEFDAIAGAASLNPQERLFQTSRQLVRFGLTHPQHFRVVFFGPEGRHGIRTGDYINGIGRPLFERLVKAFGECVGGHGLRVSEPLLAAHTWWSNIFGLTMVLIIQGDLPDFSATDRVVEQTIHTLWAGFQANPSVPPPPPLVVLPSLPPRLG